MWVVCAVPSAHSSGAGRSSGERRVSGERANTWPCIWGRRSGGGTTPTGRSVASVPSGAVGRRFPDAYVVRLLGQEGSRPRRLPPMANEALSNGHDLARCEAIIVGTEAGSRGKRGDDE